MNHNEKIERGINIINRKEDTRKMEVVNGITLDYSKMVFERGIVCYNTNNHNKCVVLDGNRGTASDRCTKTLEYSHDGLFVNTPPNRALIPTGEFIDISQIESVLNNG